MVTYKCPCCGHVGDKPILFSITRQRVFAYIWDNPGCTVPEIKHGLRAKAKVSIVANYVKYIEKRLRATTNLRLDRKPIPRKGSGARLHALKIINYKPPIGVTGATTEGPEHGTV